MISRQIITYHANRTFALEELLEVTYEKAFNAVNEGTDEPEAVLERVKNLLHTSSELAGSLAMDLSNLIADTGPDAPTPPMPDFGSDELNQALAEADSFITKAERLMEIQTESASAKRRKEIEPVYTAVNDAAIQITRAITALNCRTAPPSGGGDQTAPESRASGMDAGCWVVSKTIIDAIDNLVDCAESDGMFKMDPSGDGSAPDDQMEARSALLLLLQPYFAENANSRYGVESTTCGTNLQNQQQIIPEIIHGDDAQPLQWVHEDDLGSLISTDTYNALFPYSKVDFVRMFPIFGPPAQSDASTSVLLDKTPGFLRSAFTESATPWTWTEDALPPMGVPVICLDDANKPHDICVATRENDWDECLCWWMHIPVVTPKSEANHDGN